MLAATFLVSSLVSAMSAPNFSLGINFEVENLAVNEYLSDKTQLTRQEVNIFVEEQRNQKTVSKFVKFIQEPPRSCISLVLTQSKFRNLLTTLNF